MTALPRRELHRYDPMRKPDWRWRRAGSLVASQRRLSAYDDEQVRRAVHYLRRLLEAETARGRSAAQRQWWAVASAHDLSRGDLRRDELEARLLAGQAPARIAARTELAEETVFAYADLFYDVLGFTQARDWLFLSVLDVPSWAKRRVTEGDVWRYAAACGGPVLLEMLLEERHGRADCPEQQRICVGLRLCCHWLAASSWSQPVSTPRLQEELALAWQTSPSLAFHELIQSQLRSVHALACAARHLSVRNNTAPAWPVPPRAKGAPDAKRELTL